MEYLKIDRFDLEFSRIGLGTWAIGGFLWGGTDEEDSIATIRSAIDNGINVIDTAPVYGFGLSEELVARAIKGFIDREKVIISTKVGLEWRRNLVLRNCTPKRIRKEIDDSLRRLNTDYIDIYFVHWPDPKVPYEQTADIMYDFLESGKIKAIGVSNYDVLQMRAFGKSAPIHFLQPPYNLFEREIESEILPYSLENDIRIFGYGSLCRGMLSGKMAADRLFEGDDIRQLDPKFKSPQYEKYLNAVDSLDSYAHDKYGKTVMELAVRWALDKGVHTALWGARKSSQLENVDNVFGWHLDDKSLAEVDNLIMEYVPEPIGPEFMGPGVRRV